MYTGDMEKTQAPPDADVIRKQIAERDYLRSRRNDVPMQPSDTCGAAGRPYSDAEIVAELFRYHPPTDLTIPRHAAINQAAKNLAEVILANCQPCADRSDAIRKLRECRMVANAAIALNGLSL